jgi:hypothetical protein
LSVDDVEGEASIQRGDVEINNQCIDWFAPSIDCVRDYLFVSAFHFQQIPTLLFMTDISLPLSSSAYSLISLLLALRMIGTIGSIVRLPAYASVEINLEKVTGVVGFGSFGNILGAP